MCFYESNTTIRQSHPSGYAASRINSSSGAENGTGDPCNTTLASTGSRLLGNSEGRRARKAGPSVCGVDPCSFFDVCQQGKEGQSEEGVLYDGRGEGERRAWWGGATDRVKEFRGKAF